MNTHEAERILRENVDTLSEPLKSAVEFTLTNFYASSAADEAKKFLRTQIPDNANLFWLVDRDSTVGDKVHASIMFMRTPAFKADKYGFPSLKNLLGRFQP